MQAGPGDAGAEVRDRRRWLAWISFDGGGFCGFQRQQGLRTVAGELEAAWAGWQHEAIVARSSSRTDAGVHARRMPVLFETARALPAKAVVHGWNARLPDDLAVLEAAPVEAAFDVRADAIGKRYVYRVWADRVRAPRRRLDHWHVRGRLDLDAARAAAALLRGDHDFAAFRASSCTARSTRRTLGRVELRGEGPALALVVEGNAFLHNMVRVIAGTVVAVGRGRFGPEQVAKALRSGLRGDAGPTAPAHGLELDEVFFGPHGARQGLEHKRLLDRLAGLPERGG
jgi:tRNA pseudouridine38-40 synthase